MQPTETLVLGAGGKTGRRVAARLAALGVPVRSRPVFEWEAPATWAPALEGVEAACVGSSPAIPAAIGAFAELAAARGTRRLVLLARRGEDGALRGERALRESGARWTVVRVGWLAQCFSEGHLLEPVLAGEVALPAPPVGEPFIDADDVADVAVAALTEDGHAGRVYDLTGPRLLTFAEAVEEVAEAAGREIRYVRVPLGRYRAMLAERGLPAGRVELLAYRFSEVLDGRNAHLRDCVRRALGREPRDFSDFARDAAAAGAWRAREGMAL